MLGHSVMNDDIGAWSTTRAGVGRKEGAGSFSKILLVAG